MEVFYSLPTESKVAFIEAIKIINKILPENKISFYHAVKQINRNDTQFILLVEHPEILITLGKLWSQLERSYDIEGVFITCKDVMRKYAHERNADHDKIQNQKRLILLFLIIACLLFVLTFFYLIKVLEPTI